MNWLLHQHVQTISVPLQREVWLDRLAEVNSRLEKTCSLDI